MDRTKNYLAQQSLENRPKEINALGMEERKQ